MSVGHHTFKHLCFNWFFIQRFLFDKFQPVVGIQYFINNIKIHAHCTYCPFRKHKMLGYLAYIGLKGILKSSSNAHFLFLLLHMALWLELLVTPTLQGPDIWIVEKVHSIFYIGINCWPFISEIWKCHWVPVATTSKFEIIFSFHKWWKGKTKISLGWREFRESVGEREEVSFTSSILKRSFTE